MITPTVGRIVHYRPQGDLAPWAADGACLAAIVTHVHSDRMVNLAVFDASGNAHSRTSVPLSQPEDEAPGKSHCCWMPYQVQKQHGSESGEKEAGTQSI